MAHGSRLTAHGSRLTAISDLSSSNNSPQPKFVIIGNPLGGTLAAAKAYGAILSKPINNIWLRRLLRVHQSQRLNSIVELPFKCVWDKALFDTSRLDPNDEIYFLFYENAKLSGSPNYFNHLRKKYKNCKLIYCLANPIEGWNPKIWERWQYLLGFYDKVITFNRSDAEKWGLSFCDYWPCLLPEKTFQPENASDVFFVGIAKDRLSKIISVYERLTDAGLKCSFYITGVPKAQQKYSGDIHYCENITDDFMTYDEVLQHDKNTKCVLEILPFGQKYSSLRVCEALWYHKKLLTTNLNAPQEWFYNSEIVQCFSNADEIDIDFIRQPFTAEDEQRIFSHMNIGDFSVFAERIINSFKS